MQGHTEDSLTAEVSRRYGGAPDPRVAQVMTALIKHLHAFAREVKLTTPEWQTAIQFLVDAGKLSSDKRNEMMLVSDVFGLSMMTVMIDQAVPQGATPNTVEGPFFIENSPVVAHGGDMRFGAPGELCYMHGRVVDMDGKPIAGALIDIWQADKNGLYEAQVGSSEPYLRAKIHSGADGSYAVRTVVPHHSIPIDGPVGELVRLTGIGHERPAHIHLAVKAPGYQPLITHLFRAGAEFIDGDAVYGVRPELIVKFDDHASGVTPLGDRSDKPFSTVKFDVVLAKA